jgi:uncharacterized repeat protein (TIGR01451 family)
MMSSKPDSERFEALSRELLSNGVPVRFEARGASMSPCIRDGQVVHVTPVIVSKLRKDDIVLTKGDRGFLLHRLMVTEHDKNFFITRGDRGKQNDPPVSGDQILGLVVAKEISFGRKILRIELTGFMGIVNRMLLRFGARSRSAAVKLARATKLRRRSGGESTDSLRADPLRKNAPKFLGFLGCLLLALAASYSHAQVAVDTQPSTNAANELTGPGTKTLTFNHRTGTGGVNRLLVVGVSLNIANDTTATVTSVTYNGVALTQAGAHNDAANSRRVEIWYLLAPAIGNDAVVVSVNVPGPNTVGVVAGATTFTGADQTVPLGSFVSADGASGGYSQLDVPSVVNGMVIDTLATGGDQAVTVPSPQVSQWNNASGGTSPPDVTAVGSTRSGAPSVPLSETFSGTSNWSLGAVSINPSGADIGVITSVGSAIFLGQNTTYTIRVSNNGPSAANTVTLKDTLAAGMTFVSATPSVGTCVTTANPITCTIGTMASGATATVTVVETATTSGSYANTAVVSDSGTPPDPNTGNNTFVAVATVQAVACGSASQATAGNNLTGILNTYYPGTANVAAGATKIPVGTATGAGAAIVAGNLLLVIQMQDASIDVANSVAYGNGYTGQGFTALNSAGDYEFVTATGPINAGSVPIAGAGAGAGLVFAYHSAAKSNNAGQSTYQVVVVPQYTTASFNSTTPPTAFPWNGSTGGVLVLDTSSTLTLNGATVSVSGLGFRGGAGMELNGGVGGNNTDYFHAAPAAYTGAVENGVDAVKGEGIAGTPLWVESAGSYLKTNTDYPSGGAADGSSARGAPGNAGAGGTDGDPTNNDQNAGGGGGSNGGSGGFGGNSWNSNLSVGGEGGTSFPATINRIAMGGGGGAGTRNNSDGDTQASAGAAGGGIIIIRTFALSGTATFTANGVSAYNGTANDAGGGGGAGGSIVVLSANGGEGGLTLQANGGNGGDAWASEAFTLGNRHGPGGGGGGGIVLVSGPPASSSVNGGTNGITENPGVPYGATPGAPGSGVTNASISQTSGTQSGAECIPDVTLGKTHVGNFTRGLTASYTIPVSNVSLYGPTNATVIVNDTLPVGLIPTGASGAGWTCFVASQTVSCINSTVLAGSSSYPSITVNANVAQTAPSTVTNTALVSGGGELNLANDTATDVATVVSSADLSMANTASPNPVAAGSNITYTQVVTNNGPSAADNVTVVEAVPANTTFVSMGTPAGWTCTTPLSGAAGNIVCSNLSLAGSTAATFSMIVKVNAAATNGTVITDSVTTSSSVSDPNTANNTAIASTVVGITSQAQMTVTNVASPDPVIAGNDITYTQTATNVGGGTATNPTLSENTPPNTTFVSISAPPGTTCTTPAVGKAGAISCTAPAAPAGSNGTVQLVVQVAAGTASGTVISDTVTATSTNQAFGANSATATTIVATAGQADLALTTTPTPLTVIAGNNITYTQSITDNGPAAASNVSFTEAIPANTTFVSVSAPAGWTCTTTTSVTCTFPSLAVNASANIIVVVNVAASITATPITETASVSAATVDPYTANNLNLTVTTPLVDKCDLTVSNSGSPSPVTAGGNLTYTQTVFNHGPSNCSAATFTEATPANTTFVSVAAVTTGGGTWTCPNSAPVSCTNPSVPPGSLATITAVYNVNAGTAAGTIITDTATGGSGTTDTNISDNSATVTTAVAVAGQADLSVTNAATPNPVTAGQNITYSQTVNNGGPAAATTVTLTETLPANTTFVSLNGPAGWTCSSTAPYTCSIASLAASSLANFTFVVKVNTTVVSGSTITGTVSVAGSSPTDPNPGNNTASASVQVANSAALSVTNAASPVPVQAGNNITYTQVVTNAGPSAATTTTLSENTPANTTFQSVTIPGGWSCTTPAVGSAGAINCTDPSFAAGTASFTVVLKVTAGTAAGTAINDAATVSSSTADPNSANNTATAADIVALTTQSDLVTTNSAAPASVAAGSNVTYTQSVTNDGPAVTATGATFTQTTPPNTSFQSITPPAGWTCVTPAVGATGTVTCTDGGTLAVNGTANFTLVLQVSATAQSGTNIAETVTATVSNVVPSLTTNSATALAVVANANSSDMAIVKTASPSPTVPQGDTLTYTLAITNNGPASATNVTVADTLPSAVTYESVISNVGTCSEADSTVTCLLGTMANAATATVTIVTMAGAPGVVTNTATVSADQTDPVTSNNTSSETETITAATQIQLHALAVRTLQDKTGANQTGTNRVAIFWKTGAEVHNLGFNVYREQNGERLRLNPSLIAGSALLMSGALPKHSGKTYAWIDSSSGAGNAAYWLEDVDVNGTRSMHGPVTAESDSSQSAPETMPATALMFNQLNQAQPAAASERGGHPVESVLRGFKATASQRQTQFELAARPAVKLFVIHEGWHRITQPELIKAGLDPNVDPAFLHLCAEAIEQPMKITGALPGPGGFGPQAALEFYGTGIDTPYSGTRIYWLATGETPGQRIQRLPVDTGSNQPPPNFPATVELTPHSTYFAALITSDGNNFFGSLVSSTPVDQTVTIPNFDASSTNPSQMEVVLQGVILGIPHQVTVTLNGTTLGNLTFTGQDKGKFRVNLPPGVLQNGDNTVTLTAQDGEYDTSLVQSIRIEYPHVYTADSDRLKFTGRAGDELKVSGFSAAPVVLDITDPSQPVELTPQITSDATTAPTRFTLQVQVPWSTTNPAAGVRHALLALAPDRFQSAAAIRSNHPSHWHRAQPGSEIVMVSPAAFGNSLLPLLHAHEAAGKSAALVFIEDLYDEFSFGEHNPGAIQEFLHTAGKVWQAPPHYLLLNGRASVDPRNYLGFGQLDFVPTKIVPATGLMTASDDWFSDFDNSGMPTIATGRLPVSSVDEANLVAGKLFAYEGQSTNGAWTSQALMVADVNDTENFTQDSETVQAQLPSALHPNDVFASTMSTDAAKQAIIAAINSGQLLVNYAGHGSEEQWSGDDLFSNTDVTSLTNSSSFPVFLIMNCLNGLFQDVYEEPLAVTLMLAPNGGAVAVLASSGLNQPLPQTTFDKLIVQNALHSPYPALGDAILKAKSGITDLSVRKTFNLLGDPAMQIKLPSQNPAH